uniref:NADH-ubiquinone oxidoreductase chain 5 n=1 Tax=Wolfiporia cocos TaxID=81056 RepID=A0A7G7YDX9_9APHY|nr:NADH dehydrogenase subunit 5 [Wolfiporia cocos]
MYLSILILPLLGSIVSGLMGRKIGVSGAHFITCTCLILSSILASVAFYEVGICGAPLSIHLNSWIDSEFLSISWEFLFDQLTVSMFIPVLYISSLIHIFSTDYMAEDPHNQRFFSYLSLFTFFMLLLVSGGNYFVMFVDLIGVVSYLLINFWFTRLQANKAAILALTMNRVGDMGLSIGFFALFALFGSIDYATVFSLAPIMNETAITIIGLLLLTGAMAKSSQIPLHSWLPFSMEDMVMAVGLSQYHVALFHVLNHSFFKALLFLGAGAVIHSFADQQDDVRRFGGLINFLPFTYSCMLVGSLSLIALPFLSGFYSKDLIIELAYVQYSFSGAYAFILGSISAGLTAFYSFRLITLVFLNTPNGSRISYQSTHEVNLAILIPLFILSLFSIFSGFVFSEMVGVGSDFFGNSLFIHPNKVSLVEAEFSLPLGLKHLPLIFTILGSVIAVLAYHKFPEFVISLTETSLGRKIYTFLNGKYLFDVVYNNYIIGVGLKLGYIISKVLDRGVLEIVGPFGLSKTLSTTGNNIAKFDSGIVTDYALYIVIALLSFIFVLFNSLLMDPSILETRHLIIFIFTLYFSIIFPVKSNNFSFSTPFRAPLDNQVAKQPNINKIICHPTGVAANTLNNKVFNRGLSTKARNSMTDQEFLEWFAGLVDGEACTL